jgi:hypothetical protein
MAAYRFDTVEVGDDFRFGSVIYQSLTTRTIGNLSLDSAVPGTSYVFPLQGTWDAADKTATLNGVALSITEQDANSITFTVPTPYADSSTHYLANLGIAYDIAVTDGDGTITKAAGFRITSPAQPTYWYASSITGGPSWNQSSVLYQSTGVSNGDSFILEVTAGGPMSEVNPDGSWVANNPIDFRVKAYNSEGWAEAWAEFEVRYEGDPVFSGPNIGNRTVAENGSLTISAGDRFTYTNAYSLTGSLPADLSFDTTTGTISGTATAVGAVGGLTVTGTDGFLTADSDTFSITVVAPTVEVEGTTKQGEQQAYIRSYSGTALHYNADFISMMQDDLGVTGRSYNALLIQWLQTKLGSSETRLSALMDLAAADRGVSRWQEITDPTAIGT